LALHFEVTRKSHATAVSQVYEAVNRHGSRYFIEMLTGAGSGPWLEAFQKDVAALAQLRHPCLLEVLELGAMPDGTPVIITDRPEGPTLALWLEQGHVAPTDAAMDLLTGLAHALGAAHDAGVSHGALTADEVVLVEISRHALGFPRLRGFGYRWLRSAAAYSGAPTMTPGERTVPAARREIVADIAALAELADRLLTPLRNSEQITSVIRAATLLGEDGRFATPAAFVEALEAAIDPSIAPREEITEPTLKVPWSQRHRGLRRVLGTAAGVVVLAAGVHALVSARNAHSVTQPEAAPAPIVVRRPPPGPPAIQPDLRPAPVQAPAVTPPVKAARPAAPARPKVFRVWSARENRLIYVDEQGAPVEPPSGSGPGRGDLARAGGDGAGAALVPAPQHEDDGGR
jgi:hypothetical protein